MARRNLLLTLDAFGTLFKPRIPIAEQYIEEARLHGLDVGSMGITPSSLDRSFSKAFRRMNLEKPFYGKQAGMTNEEWWEETIHATFHPFLSPTIPARLQLPKHLTTSLLARFSGKKAYELYPDVLPFLQSLTQDPAFPLPCYSWREKYSPLRVPSDDGKQKNKDGDDDEVVGPITILGILSNTDPRVKLILEDLGIAKYFCAPTGTSPQQPQQQQHQQHQQGHYTLSYDTELAKPAREIFRRARTNVLRSVYGPTVNPNVDEKGRLMDSRSGGVEIGGGGYRWDFVHVGNDLMYDYIPTLKLMEWRGVWIDRTPTPPPTSPLSPPPTPFPFPEGDLKTKFTHAMKGPCGLLPQKGGGVGAQTHKQEAARLKALGGGQRQKYYLKRPELLPGYECGRGPTGDPVRDVVGVRDLREVFGVAGGRWVEYGVPVVGSGYRGRGGGGGGGGSGGSGGSAGMIGGIGMGDVRRGSREAFKLRMQANRERKKEMDAVRERKREERKERKMMRKKMGGGGGGGGGEKVVGKVGGNPKPNVAFRGADVGDESKVAHAAGEGQGHKKRWFLHNYDTKGRKNINRR
ncbi:hypothetical protein DFH27DRAFT_644025 [Peziza echinospora]|nr:hypothetical protein DFH27DRAFT_644025 [Peziza echinospora]